MITPHVVILNGPAGVGKSVVGRALAALVPNGACIHGDDLKAFTVTRQEGMVRGGLAYVNGATVAANFLNAGYTRVVFEFVFETPTAVGRFLDAFTSTVPVHLFTLWAPLDITIAREASRAYRDRIGGSLGDRVTECHRTMAAYLNQLGEIIENVGQSVEETAAHIHHRYQSGNGLLVRS